MADENEEFEFRLRAEKEAAAAPKQEEAPKDERSLPGKIVNGAGDVILGAAETVADPIIRAGSSLAGNFARLLGAEETGKKIIEGGKQLAQPETTTGKVVEEAIGKVLSPIVEPIAKGIGEYTNPIFEKYGELAGSKEAGEAAKGLLGSAAELAFAGKAKGTQKEAPLSPREEVLQKAQKEGMVRSPADINKGQVGSILEGAAGPAKVKQRLSRINQEEFTNKLAQRELGVDVPLTPEVIEKVKSDAYRAGYEPIKKIGTPFKSTENYYRAIGEIGRDLDKVNKQYKGAFSAKEISDLKSSFRVAEHDPETAMEAIRMLRFHAKKNLVDTDPVKNAVGRAQQRASKALEDMIEENLQSPEMLANFRAARKKIAIAFDIEKAMNPATGDVSAAKLARSKSPLSGGLKTIADAFKADEKSLQDVARLPKGEHSAVDAAAALLGGVAHRPLATGMSLARAPLRMALTSKPGQKALAGKINLAPRPLKSALLNEQDEASSR